MKRVNQLIKDALPASAKDLMRRLLGRKFVPSSVNQFDDMIRLGSEYGGWYLHASKGLYESTILSVGAGEDISFDIEFAAKFSARVIIIDPTPRSVEHVKLVSKRLGAKRKRTYIRGGNQPIISYDLEKLKPEQISLCEKAIWTESTQIEFFAPKNENSVSHSIVDYRNNFKRDLSNDHIFVETVTYEELLEKYRLEKVPLIKLDIEGAELDVVPDILASRIQPLQLLVEFDGLQKQSRANVKRYQELDKLLVKSGYTCAGIDGFCNFSYLKCKNIG